MRKHHQPIALLLSVLLVCVQLPAQSPSTAQQPAGTTRPDIKPDAKRSQKAAERGAKAEAAGHLEEALAAYQEAALYAPQDAAIVEHAAVLRSKLVRMYAESAERAALGGHLSEATEALAAALKIDPGNTIVMERLGQMKTMEDESSAKSGTSEITGLPKLRPKTGNFSFNLRGDTKTAYEQLATLYGVKAVFDPDLTPRNVRLRLDKVDFDTAVSVLGTQTGTFWRPLNPTLMFVAPDTQEKRKQYALEAEQTFALPAAVGPEDATEMLRILRDITGATHITLDTRSHTITMRDTPERLAIAEELIHQTEMARGEVMLEIELLEVNRDTAQKIGITPPASARLFTVPPNLATQLSQAQNISALQTLLAGIFGGLATGGATTIASLIPQFMVIGGGKSTFLLTMPTAAADFSTGLSLVRSGRQVLLRAQDGKPATFFVGDRYPITLSLLSSSLGSSALVGNVGGASNPFPSTSFPVGVDPVSLVAADFQNNGLIDLAVVNQLDNSITVLMNQGAQQGTFVQATGSPISLGPKLTAAPPSPPAIASATLTSKGFHDLLVTDSTKNVVNIFFSVGDGTFVTPATSIPVGNQPSSIVTADFNGDGFQDLAVSNFKDNTFSVFLGGADASGKPTFIQAPGSPFPLPTNVSGPVAMTVADFNSDGKPDLAILNQTTLANPSIPQGNVVLLQGKGDGTFTEFPGSPILVGQNPVALASADLDGNSTADLAIVNNTDNSVTVLLNKGDGTFVAGPNSPLATSPNPTGIAISNFAQNGAGIAVTCAGSNTVRVFVGIRAGFFTVAFEPPAGPAGSLPTAIIAPSLISGGTPDVVIANNVPGAAGDVTVIISPANLFSTSGLAQQPYPGAEYVDLGVKIKATPALHPNNEVTLLLEFEIRALTGNNVNGIPIISNRTLTQTVRVKEDQATLIGGITDVEETRSITGLPGFAEIPGIGYAFGVRGNSLQDTELLIVVTPRKLRIRDRLTRTIFAGHGDPAGHGGVGPGGVPAPAVQPTPPPGGQPPPAPGGPPPQ